ncbi:hypothetical protein PSTG_07475, partial [Puccinia striiformis f. sp. tritici PST-78]
MSNLEEKFERLMKVVEEERTLRKKAEADLAADVAAAKQAADLAAATAATQLANANAVAAAATANPKKPKMSLPSKFDGTRGEKAEAWVRQIGVYMMSHPDEFTDDRTKVMWTLSFLDGPALAWSQQFSDKLFRNEEVRYQDDFAVAFTAMYFDPEKKPKAEAALRKLKQTKSVSDYTHQFSIHANYAGWETTTLISHYKQGLKGNVRLALVLSRAEFETVAEISNLALKIDNELNGTETQATPSTSTIPTADPDAMDLSAINGRLSEAEKTRMMKAGLCFRCGTRGHLARDCPDKNGKGKNRKDVRIAELEEENQTLKGKAKEGNGQADHKDNTVVKLGASRMIKRNEFDPRLFISMPLVPLNYPPATTPLTATFLIDSGATHDVISESYAEKAGILATATPSERVISGFDGTKSCSSYDIDIYVDRHPQLSRFIVTQLKDSYDGILGMPWIQKNGHLIDWTTGRFKDQRPKIATAKAVSSLLPKTASTSVEPVRHARKCDEGVCVEDTIALPQCKLDSPVYHPFLRTTGQYPLFQDLTHGRPPTTDAESSEIEPAEPTGTTVYAFARASDPRENCGSSTIEAATKDGVTEVAAGPRALDNHRSQTATAKAVSSIPETASASVEPVRHARKCDEGVCVEDTISTEILAAKASWSTSAQLAARGQSQTTPTDVKELVPKCYHAYLDMFRKTEAQKLPPRRRYDFRVDLLPGATPQASRIIPLSPAESQVLD